MTADWEMLINTAIEKYLSNVSDKIVRGAIQGHIEGQIIAARQLGITLKYQEVTRRATEYATEYSRLLQTEGGTIIDGQFVPWFKKYGENLTEAFTSTVQNGLMDTELTQEDLGRQIADLLGVTQRHGELIAQHEVRQVQAHAAIQSYQDQRIDYVVVVGYDIPDGTVCEECQEYMDHGKYDINEAPFLPAHPNCLLPDTRCETPGGIVSGLRTFYDGLILEITTSNGSKLSVTPNHMLLTLNGFVAADLVCEGDDILYCPDTKRIVSDNPNDDRQPPTIKEIFDSLMITGSVTTRSVPVSPEYLHGDGKFCKSNIDIVTPDCFLRDAVNTATGKKVDTSLFNRGCVPGAFDGCGDLASVLEALSFASDGGMSGTRESAPFFRGRVRHTDKHRLALRSLEDVVISHDAKDGLRGDVVLSGQFFNTDTRNERFDDVGVGKSESSLSSLDIQSVESPVNCGFPDVQRIRDLVSRQSGLIQCCKVVTVDVRSYTGHVYDLQTMNTVYIGNNCILSNCRHNYAPYIPGVSYEPSVTRMEDVPESEFVPLNEDFQTMISTQKNGLGARFRRILDTIMIRG